MFGFFTGPFSDFSEVEDDNKKKTPEEKNMNCLENFLDALSDEKEEENAQLLCSMFSFDFKKPASIEVEQLEKLFVYIAGWRGKAVFKNIFYTETEILNLLEQIIESKRIVKEEKSETVPTFEEGLLLQKENPEKAIEIFHNAIEKKSYLAYRFNEIEEEAIPENINFPSNFILNLTGKIFSVDKLIILIKNNPSLIEVQFDEIFTEKNEADVEKIKKLLTLNQDFELRSFKERVEGKKKKIDRSRDFKNKTTENNSEEKEKKKDPKESALEEVCKGMQYFKKAKFKDAIDCFHNAADFFGYDPFLSKYLLKAYKASGGEKFFISPFDKIIPIKQDDFICGEKELGRGMYGAVYDGKINNLKVAIKIVAISKDDEKYNKTNFDCEEEIRIQTALKGQKGVVNCYGYCVDEEEDENKGKSKTWQIIFELMDCTLTVLFRMEAKRKEEKKLTPEKVHTLLMSILWAVFGLHNKDIAHQDLKPDNFLIKVVNEQPFAFVSDFGKSREIKDISSESDVTGTPDYLSWELLKSLEEGNGLMGDIDPKAADIYALGLILWELWQYLLFKKECANNSGYWYGKSRSELFDQLNSGKIPPFSEGTHNFFTNVVSQTLSNDPKKRPPIDNVIEEAARNKFYNKINC